MLKKLLLLILIITTHSYAQSPGNISSDLSYWFKADTGTSTTTDGVAITQWNNNIGTIHATQAGSSNYPVYKENSLNFNPSVYFASGDSGYFDLDLDDINDTNYNLIAIVERGASDERNYILGTRSTTKSEGLHFGYRDNNDVTLAQYGDDVTVGVNEYDNPSISRSIVRGQVDSSNGKTIQELRDGKFTTRTLTNLKSFLTGGNPGTLGRGFGNDGFKGHISEVIIYTETLSDADLAKIYSYLAVKYGMTLDVTDGNITNGDYQDSHANIIWDASLNTTYHHQVIGIGRDDDSGLEQIKSIDSDEVLTIDKTSSFTTDLDFIMVGNDDETLALSSDNTSSSIISQSQRTWKVQTSGTPGTISVSFNLGGSITNSGNASDYALVIDSDTDFTDAPTHTTGASITGNTITFTNVNFSDGDYFTLGISSVINAPGHVTSNAVGWFKADTGTSTTVNGSAITQWNNNFGFVNATQAGTTNFATYQEEVHNFNPSVYFADGDTGYFDVDLDDINNTDYNIIAIVERDATVADNYFIGTVSTSNNQGLHLGYSANNTLTFNQVSDGVDVTVNNFDNPSTSTSLVRSQLDNSNGKTIQELRDGSLSSATDVAATSYLTGNQQGVLGKGNNGHGFNGYVSEVITYNSTLTNAELTKIYSYLAIKYGMTLDASDGITNGDYQDSNANIVWDESVNTAYHHEVIGVGRDDKSTLEHLKSIEPSSSPVALTVEKTASFENDQEFLMIGNDAGTIGTTTTGKHHLYSERVERTWKVQATGTTGLVTISFTVGNGITNTGDVFDYAILIDNDTDFSDATVHNSGATLVGNVVSFTDVDLSDGNIFTLAVGSLAKAPGGSISAALVNWFKADYGTSTTTDGVAITQWNNSDVLSTNHAVQAGGSDLPTYQGNIHNFNPSVYIPDGDNGYFTLDLDAIKNTDYNIIAIVERDATETQNYIMGTTGGTRNEALHFGYRSNGVLSLAQYSNDINLNVNDFDEPNTSIALIRGEVDSSVGQTIQELRDGDFKGNINTSLRNFLTGTNPGVIGRGHNSAGFNGYVSEILMYSGALTDADLTKIYSYLGVKYGMTLDVTDGITDGDYQDSNGNVIWDASSNSDYHQQIAIIGLDEDSDLNQKQSKSESANSILTLALGNSVAASNSANGNSFTSDLDFLAVGSKSTSDVFAIECGETIYKVNRDWKVQKTGFSGTETITLQFDMTGISIPEDFDLLIDTDGDFTTTGDQTTNTGGSLSVSNLTFSAIDIDDLSSGAVFTLIRKASYDLVYDGSWSGDAPDTSDGDNRVVIQSNLTIGASFACDCLKIDSGVVLTIGDIDYVDTDELILNGDLYLEGDAELIQVESTDLNSGTGQVYKIINDATSSGYRFNYLTSPVNTSGTYSLSGNLKFNTGANLGVNTDPSFIDNDSDGFGTTISSAWLYTLNSSGTYTKIDEDTDLDPGVGFTMKGTNQENDYNFIGSPNNGDIDALTLVTDEYAIVGNPYPSAIDADTFNTTMLASNITDGVVYLWNQPTGDSHYQDQYDGGYATRIAGVGAPAAGVTGASTPTNIIKPGQGFTIAGGTSGGMVTFTNAMRISNTSSSGTQFYKTTKQTALKPIIRLGFEFESEKGRYHRQLVTTPSGGTLGHDNGQDAPMFDGYKNDAYWLVKDQEERYVITTVPVVSEDLQLDLGVVLEEEKEVTFTLDEAELFSNDIYLLDKELNNITDIRATDYTTQVSQGTNTDRFSLVFKEDATLNTELIEDATKMIIYNENKIIHILLSNEIVKQVYIYNLAGVELVNQFNEINGKSINVNVSNLQKGIYIINVITNKTVHTSKIILE